MSDIDPFAGEHGECAHEINRLLESVRVLREALAMAVLQNTHDMVMTGEEIRKCYAALDATK